MTPQSPSQRVAANVRAELARANITQTALASRMNRTQQSLSLRLRGHVAFSVDELSEIADLLGVDISYLIDGSKASA